MLTQVATRYSQKIKAFAIKRSHSKCAEDIGADLDNEYKSPSSDTEYSYTDISISSLSDCAKPSSDPEDHGVIGLDHLIYNEQSVLMQHGLKKIKTLCDTQQGELIEAVELNSDDKGAENKVIIKKVSRALHAEKIVLNHTDDMTYCTTKDIIKEALILNHLTVENQPACHYMTRLIRFFHCDEFYYLVLEHVASDSMNLKEFVAKSHQYMLDGRLTIKEYIKVIKFIFWQLFVLMHWMHNDMSCCHLDLKLEHVILQDVKFLINAETNAVRVAPNISVKLCDFGSAEIFKNGKNGKFKCNKEADPFTGIQYQSPQLVDEQIYDARKADIWALGMMLFHCCIGRPLYSNLFEAGYVAVKRGAVANYLKVCNLRKYIKKHLMDLLRNTVKMNEEERFTITDVLKHSYFRSYYGKYKDKIEEKSQSQRQQLLEQSDKLLYIPYYKLF